MLVLAVGRFEEYTMLAPTDPTYFHDVAHRVRNLLSCEAVLLALDCPVAELRHPLLEWVSITGAARRFGASELQCLFQEEEVRALRDVACQSGHMRFMHDCRFLASGMLTRSVAIAPVERPAGILAHLVLVNAFAGAFTAGDARLLHDYLTSIQFAFEGQLRTLCSLPSNSGPHGIVEARAALPEINGNSARNREDGLKNDLISMVSHELRAPLTAIKGYTGLLQAYSVEDRQQVNEREVTITPARQQQYLDIIMQQAGHLEVLMGDLLDVSRIQAGKLALRFTEVNVETICQQVLRLAQQRIDQQRLQRHTLRCQVSPDLPSIQADPHRLQQILQNLLDNAIKYSPHGGLIELLAGIEYPPLDTQSSAAQHEALPLAQITIRDQGIGISAQQRARLFRPFSRLDHPLTSQVQGAGLGLYITHKLVQAMQGTIELDSREHHGTSVTLRFPLRQRAESPQFILAGELMNT
ncbi:MAG: hypothetical protein NVS3B14_03750 [Ktedonobacteraceae bacterium]